jgi:outer membrane receptor protein involved in Fe transport
MTLRQFKPVLPILALVLPLLLLGPSTQVAAQAPAQPQPQATPSPTPDEKAAQAEKEGLVRVIEEVTVTGSLIQREDIEALSPVTVIDVEEVTYQGTGRVEDLIQQLPQAFAAQNASISNGASGTATVQLRNLGAERTLSLLNGRRMASGDAYSTAADLNFIPSTLIRRVDILTGGAGAAYGADAVAGVVNFVLDTEFEGFRGEIQQNGFQHSNDNALAQQINQARGYTVPSGSTWNNGGTNLSLAVGGKLDGGKGHASAFVSYRDIDAIWKDQRDYTNCSVQNLGATGPACGGSATWQYGRFLAPGRGDFVLDPATGNTNTFRTRRSTDVFNFAPFNFMQRNDRNWGGGAFAHYRFNEKVAPYAELQFIDDRSDAQIAPSGNFFNTTTINCDNPMMSAQQRSLVCGTQTSGSTSLFIGRRNVEGGNRTEKLRHLNWRMLAGIRGDLSKAWNYDVYAMNANVASPRSYINDLNGSRVADALDVVGTPGQPSTWRCRSGNAGCAPWNIFQLGGVTQAALDYISTNALNDTGTNTKVLNATMRGDLTEAGLKFPSATEGIQIAFGGEIRREALFVNPDEVYEFGLRTGSGGPTNPVDGSYVTKEGFAEISLPFVQDAPGVRDLSLELGFRYMNYKASGQEAKNNSSYKAMLSYAPVGSFRVRGGFNRAVRAPNVQELFAPQGLGLGGSEDICAGPSPTATREQCARTGVSPSQYGNILENPAGQYNSLDGGNPLLDVEKADTITAGFVWTPKSIAGLSVTADYYDIKIDQTIDAFAPDDVVKKCAEAGDPALCRLVHRDSLGTLWLTTNAFTIATQQNIGKVNARGIDLSASYPLNLGKAGYINLAMLGSTMLENSLDNPLVAYDCIGFMGNQCGNPSPKWRHRLRASWNTNFKATFSLGWRYIASVENDDLSDDEDLGNPGLVQRLTVNGSNKFPAFNWFDFAATYKVREKLRLTVGCNNLLDKEPPLGAGLSDIDFGPGYYGMYDYLGRALYANLQFEF